MSSKVAAKLKVTGIFAVSCKHGLFLPNGVVDFHKGERYGCKCVLDVLESLKLCAPAGCRYRYVDVALVSGLLSSWSRGVKDILWSYDIACKHGIWFFEHVREGPDPLLPPDFDVQIRMLVNKFHLAGHVQTCADNYSFNYTRNVGQMSGELVESLWALLNGFQYITREMGAGHREETLVAGFLAVAWWKIVKMGECFPNRPHRTDSVSWSLFQHSSKESICSLHQSDPPGG